MTIDIPPEAANSLLEEAIGALRAAGRNVRKFEDARLGYSIDGGPSITAGAVVALAWDTGLMSSDSERQ